MAYPTPEQIDAAIPVDGEPNRALANELLKDMAAAVATAATPGKLAMRTSGGQVKALAGVASDDCATVGQFDALLGARKDVAGGVAGLDEHGRISVQALPTTTQVYKGVWDAAENLPLLEDGQSGVLSGDYYQVGVAGTQDLGSGEISFLEGDQVFYNGDVWEKVIASNRVTSVNTQTGDVVLGADDIAYDDTQSIKEKIDSSMPERVAAEGAILASGEKISIICGGVEYGVEWLNSGSVRQYIKSVSGAQTIDLRRLNIWGGGALDVGYWDGLEITEEKYIIDVETYDDSNETMLHHLREGGRVWQISGFLSGNAARCSIWAERVI